MATLRLEPKTIKGDIYLSELAQELKITGEYTTAGRILRWALHNLRDRVEKEVSYKILSHLPPYLRMVYVDQWELNNNHSSSNAFALEDIVSIHNEFMNRNIPPRHAERWAIKAVFRVICRFVSPRDFEEIYNCLPEKFKFILFEDALPNPVQ